MLAHTALLLSSLACLLTLQRVPSPADTRVDWLRKHTVSVATVAPDATDFQDLMPLKKAIGGARMVLLGELTHGDGTGFEAKVRLVKFLHEVMGFDVLVWESGLFDCEQMDSKLGSEEPLEKVARMGVFGHWTEGRESFPVFEYARQTQRTARPLRMAGFDIQPSGTVGGTQYPTFLEWLSEPSVLSPELRKRLTDAFATAREAASAPNPTEVYAQVGRLLRATDRDLLRTFEANEKAITKKIGKREYAFRRRCLLNAGAYGRMMESYEKWQQTRAQRDMAEGFNLRDQTNAENLLWLLNERYRGKKLIVWAHNAHIFAGWPNSGNTSGEAPQGEEMDSMGRPVKQMLGDKAYALGFMAHAGQWSWMGNPVIAYPAAEANSLENLLHQVGKPYLFLDLRPVRNDPKHWLNLPVSGCINQQSPQAVNAVWPKGYDGIFFIDEMKPRTQRNAQLAK